MSTTTKSWLYSVAAAFIAGGSQAALQYLQTGALDWKKAIESFLVAGTIGVLLLLKQSPLPPKQTAQNIEQPTNTKT